MQTANVAPALANVLVDNFGNNSGSVLNDLLRSHGKVADLDRGVGGWAHAQVGRVKSRLDLLCYTLWCSNDVLWLLRVLLCALVDVCTRSKTNRNRAL